MTDMDPRSKTARWKKQRLVVFARDMHRCWVVDCPNPGNVCDHIDPVYRGMPDSEFYGLHNLRGSCKRHNTARGVAARLERETAGGVVPAPRRAAYGHARSTSGFLGRGIGND